MLRGDVVQAMTIRKGGFCNGSGRAPSRQGRIAGWNMAGLSVRDDGDIPVTRFTSSGMLHLLLGALTGDETHVRGNFQEDNYRNLVFSRSHWWAPSSGAI